MCGLIVSFVFNILPLVPGLGFAFPSALPGYFITSALAIAVTVAVSLATPKQKLSPKMDAVMKL